MKFQVTNMSTTVLVSSLLLLSSQVVTSDRILVVNLMNSKSVKQFYETLYIELATRGHDLVIISPFKTKEHPRIQDIVGRDIFATEQVENGGKEGGGVGSDAFRDRLTGQSKTPLAFTPIFVTLCRSYYEMPQIQKLLSGEEKFDLIMATYTFNECGFGMIQRLQTPFILLHANVPLPWNNPTGLPYPLSHLALPYFGYTDDMTFMQRVINFLAAKTYEAFHTYWAIPQMEAVYREFLGEETPSVDEIAKNVSLIFANSHYSLNFPRETMPDIVEIGGMHCRSGKPLPKDLQDFLDSSDGFILFSLGSIVKSNTMPEDMRKLFLTAFSKLKEKVLWKFETENMTDLPQNVRIGKWLPQQDILAHPKIRLFITHGGLHSVEESVYHGVPIIGIPFYGDQDANMKVAEHFAFARTLQLTNLTEEGVLNSIRSILNDERCKENALKMSKIFKDRLESSPLSKAVFHVEYVLRHKGAHHLRSPARNLNAFAYHSLDVISVLCFSLVAFTYIVWNVIKLIVYMTCCRKGDKKTSIKKHQ